MPTLTLLFAAVLLLICQPTAAATWVDIAGNDQVQVYLDTDSQRLAGGRVRTWLLWKWTEDQDLPGAHPLKKYRTEKQLQVSDCNTRTFAIAQGIRYADDAGMNPVDSYTVEERHWQFSEAAPETIGETILRLACKQARPAKQAK